MGQRRAGMPSVIARRQKQIEAAHLRATGLSWREVAGRVGYSSAETARVGAMHAIERATQEASDELVDMEIHKLDALHRAVWPKALDGDPKAVESVLRIMQRRSKFLGLDAAESRVAAAVEQAAGTLEAQTALVAVALDRVLRQLDLSESQWEQVPSLMAEELGQ